jgi:stage IV sporulation protein A
MNNFDIYKDIADRTNGDIYIGVVGPVRTGKSTFIKRFMDIMVLPNMDDDYKKERTKDELPQSAAGKTIMTTEPKFVPNEAITLKIDDKTDFRVRMIDCVGYLIPEASGHLDGDMPRLVSTPWSDEKMPFSQAAEIGTKKVIKEHSTIGVVITTDGSVTDISRESYEDSEQRVVNELKETQKPFVVILNTTHPYSDSTIKMTQELSQKYEVPVIAENCATLKAESITNILESILYEFPLKEIKIQLPKWVDALSCEHWLKNSIISIGKKLLSTEKLSDAKKAFELIEECENVKKSYLNKINPGEGSVEIDVSLNDNLFYVVLSETTDTDIKDDLQLISTLNTLSNAKKEYDKVKYALEEVKRKGYGIVIPEINEMEIEKPEIIKHGNRYGVKIKATAPGMHIIKTNIKTEVAPIVGSEEQSKELIDFLNKQYETDKSKIWEYNIFGKSLSDLVCDGLQSKLYNMSEETQIKFQDTLQKIINEGNGGLICIIL